MSVSATTSLAPPIPSEDSNVTRRSADFHPDVWGDHFIRYVEKPTNVDETIMNKIKVLKDEVRKMLVPVNEKAILIPLREANLIDSIQQLGLYHHFEHEMGKVLQHIHNNYVENGMITFNEDLHVVALVFRLLRQQGYHILPDVFKKFMDEQDKFNEKLIDDVEGMISLYEAAHMRICGEDILDEAIVFTSSHLKLISTKLSSSLKKKVNNCLKRPIHKNLPRIVARNYISTYAENPSCDEALLLLAKLDFNLLQTQHQRELGYISMWWKDLNFATKLPFARDRIVECYFWILGVYYEPQYSLGRILMTKVISLTSAIDDIYDVYGTLEELLLFTEAIQRWDISCLDFLPEYMKFCYKAILDVFEEIEQEMAKEGKIPCVVYVKNELIRLVQGYLVEAKWFNNNYKPPTMDEYMDVAMVTSAYHMLTATSFIGMGSVATEEEFKWLANNPKIVNASTIICRLMDDIVSSEFEQKRGHVVSAVECYMKQHGVSKEDCTNEFLRQVTNAWKDINEELLDLTELPKPVLMRVLNLSRVIDVLYKDEDGYTHASESTKNTIKSLLLNPI